MKKITKALFGVGKWIGLIIMLLGPAWYILFEFNYFELTNIQLTKSMLLIGWFLVLTFIYYNVLIKGEENGK